MAFSKANPEKAAEYLQSVKDRKHYKYPKQPKRPKKRKPRKVKPKEPKTPNKIGPLSATDKAAVEALVLSVTPDETEIALQNRGRALGRALRRTPEAIRREVVKARERLQAGAGTYVDLHMKAARNAAQMGDAKPAQWALEHIVAVDEKGKKERIVEPAKSEDNGPRMPVVNIGIALGGITPGASLSPGRPKVEIVEVDIEDTP